MTVLAWYSTLVACQVLGDNIGTAITKKSGRPYWFWSSCIARMGRGRYRRHSLRKRVPPCEGGKLAYSESNASVADANILVARENLHSKMQMSQMLMQHQNLRPRISLNQPLIHKIKECKIYPLNQVLIQLNPRAQVFPCKKRICISIWCKLNPRLQVFGHGHQFCVSIWFIDIRDCKSLPNPLPCSTQLLQVLLRHPIY